MTQEQKKLLEAAKKKVKLIVLKKMLQSVGVSTTGDGSSLLAQDSRSKESQLENASIVAALVAGMTRGMRSIYVSVEIAEYVALLQKYELLDGTATLADKLDAMPRTKSKEANRVRDALAKKARSAAVESSPVDEDDDDEDDYEDDAIDEYQDALREQEEKEDGVQKRTKQLREKRIEGVAVWVAAKHAALPRNPSARSRAAGLAKVAREEAKEKDGRPTETALKAYLSEENLITTGSMDELASRALNPTEHDQITVKPDSRASLVAFLRAHQVFVPTGIKVDQAEEAALVVAQFLHSDEENSDDNDPLDAVPPVLRSRVEGDPPPDNFRSSNLFDALKIKYPEKAKRRAPTTDAKKKKKKKKTRDQGLATPGQASGMSAPSESDFASVTSSGKPTAKVSAPRGRRKTSPQDRANTIKPSELKNATETLKRKAAEVSIKGNDSGVDAVVIVRRKVGESFEWEIAGGQSEASAKQLVTSAARIIFKGTGDERAAKEYRETKKVKALTVVDASATLKASAEMSSKKKTAANRTYLGDITPKNASGIVREL